MLFVSDAADPARLAGVEDVEGLLRRGQLQVATVEETYREIFDPAAQLAIFEEVLDQALGEGYSGMCVVADNSRLVVGSDEEFAAWLAWESAAEWFEAKRPVTGICYFDRAKVTATRLADLAAMHPVLSSGFDAPDFQVFVDGDVLRLVGEVDSFCSGRLHRILTNVPKTPELDLDLSEVAFMNHRALLALNQAAGDRHQVRIFGARPIVRRVWDLLDLSTPELKFCQ